MSTTIIFMLYRNVKIVYTYASRKRSTKVAHFLDNDSIYKIMKLSRDIEKAEPAWIVQDTLAKCTEELGELSEATMVKLGKIEKDKETSVIAEVADTMVTNLDVLARMYPDKTPDELHTLLNWHIERASLKWADKVIESCRK